MPVAQGGPPPLRQAAAVGAAAVLGLLAILFLVTQMDRLLGRVGSIDVSLGDGFYQPGNVEDLAPAIEENGPLLLPDLAQGDRDVFLQHVGSDESDGWLAIAVRPQTASRDCYVQWEADTETFVDNCDGTVYPADGEGLPHYPVSVGSEGDLIIDLNRVLPATDS